MKICGSILELHLLQVFCHAHTGTQTDRHFSEIVKLFLEHRKTFKSIKTQQSKIVTKPKLSPIYIDESNNRSDKRA